MNLAGLPSFDFESIIKSAVKKMNPHPVMNIPEYHKVLDFTSDFDRDSITAFINSGGWAVGGYLEKRSIMYLAPQYKNERNIHMGIDIWAPANEPVFSVFDGEIVYSAYHDEDGNYGGTLVLKHVVEGQELYVLYGHLSVESLDKFQVGEKPKKGEIVGWLGNESENGNWPPHLHYQVSIEDPGEADMPGVVAKDKLIEARKKYPDPRILLGDIY